jgi:hypothetical protein
MKFQGEIHAVISVRYASLPIVSPKDRGCGGFILKHLQHVLETAHWNVVGNDFIQEVFPTLGGDIATESLSFEQKPSAYLGKIGSGFRTHLTGRPARVGLHWKSVAKAREPSSARMGSASKRLEMTGACSTQRAIRMIALLLAVVLPPPNHRKTAIGRLVFHTVTAEPSSPCWERR